MGLVNVTLIKILLGTAASLVVAAAGYIFWLDRFGGPTIRTLQVEDRVVVANVFLGEYYLGFSEIAIREKDTDRTLFRAVRQGGGSILELELGPDIDLGVVFAQAGWTVTEHASDWRPAPGATYRFVCVGNNGSGYQNRSSVSITIPHGTRTVSAWNHNGTRSA